MFPGTLGLPGKSHKRGGIAGCLGLLLAACVALTLIGVVLGLIASSQPRPTLPTVVITDPKPGDSVGAMDEVVVFAHAQDPDRIARAELLVNGQLVATQGSPEQQGSSPFFFSQSWRPTQAGAYSVMVRAYDTVGYVGQSDQVILQVAERSFQPDPNATMQDFNDQGKSIIVPQPPDEGQPDDNLPPDNTPPGAQPPGSPPPGGGEDQVPQVDPSPVEDPLPGEGQPGEAPPPPNPSIGDLLGRLLPLCGNFPVFCGFPGAGDSPPKAPSDVAVASRFSCSVDIRWSYSSEDVTGFYIMQVPNGGVAPNLVEIVGKQAPQGNERMWYAKTIHIKNIDATWYQIIAFNGAGQTPSHFSELLEVPCNEPNADVPIEFELLDIDPQGQYDTVYCYVSVGGSPFEKVLEITQDAVPMRNTIEIEVPNAPLTVAARCAAWRGEDWIPLGDIQKSHPPPWDENIVYHASPADGGFEVTYRIGPGEGAVAPTPVPGSRIANLEVTLQSLKAGDLADDDWDATTVQAYGTIHVYMASPSGEQKDDVVLKWNPGQGGCGLWAGVCRLTSIHESIGSEEYFYSWENMDLRPEGGDNRVNPTFSIPVRSEQDSLRINWSFKDYDRWSGKDGWCSGDHELSSPRSAHDWSDTFFTTVTYGSGEHGSCAVSLNVKGSPP